MCLCVLQLRAELLEERIKHKAEIHVLELTLREGECAVRTGFAVYAFASLPFSCLRID